MCVPSLYSTSASSATAGGSSAGRRRRVRRREDGRHHAAPSREYDADESDSELELPAGYHQIAIQVGCGRVGVSVSYECVGGLEMSYCELCE